MAQVSTTNKKILKFSDYVQLNERQKVVMPYIGGGYVIFFGGNRGGGKMQSLDSIVMTPFGERKMGEIKEGDIISNPNGSPQKVIQVHEHPQKELYRLIFEDGASTECGLEHLWLIKKTSTNKTKVKSEYLKDELSDRGRIMDTRQIIKWLDDKNSAHDKATINNQHICVPLSEPIKFTKSYKIDMRPIHPYLLGVMIGDGCFTATSLNRLKYTSHDQEIADRLNSFGYEVSMLSDGKT